MEKQDIYKLAGETGCNHTTVARWANGDSVSKTTDYALRAACEKMGIAPPPRASEDSAVEPNDENASTDAA